MVRGVIIAVLVGFIGGDLLLDVMFPMPAAAVQTCCEGWKPCPGRKKIRQHGHTYTWYCGPSDDASDAGTSTQSMDAGAAARRTEKRSSRSRADAKGTHAAQ